VSDWGNRHSIPDRALFARNVVAQTFDHGDDPMNDRVADRAGRMPLAMTPETAKDGRSVIAGDVAGAIAPEDLLTRLRTKHRQHETRTALVMEQERRELAITYGELWRRASRIAGALVERGIEPGDRIAILSESRPEWAICLLAGLLAGAIVVPLDYMLEEGELRDILDDSAPSALFTSEKFLRTGENLTRQASSLKNLFLINGRPPSTRTETIGALESATPVPARQPGAGETAMLVYTSGTMGKPKGVVTTFGALAFQVAAIQDRFHLTAEDRFLSILPLNHLLELTVVLLGALHAGACVVYAHSLFPADILRLLRNGHITIVVGVPVFFRALSNSVLGRIANQPLAFRILFRGALSAARYLPAWRLRRLLFFRLHRHFGGTLRFCATGGAYLEPSLIRFFQRLGIPLLQGYGLTETGPVISVNGLGMNRAGSVGKPLAGVEVRIDRSPEGDGEILTRGPHVMAGYYNQPDLTQTAIDEAGWFHTGDIGELDADGYLYVTGRRKNVIVLDSGKNVQPEEVEEAILKCPLVRECCVIGRPARHGSFERTEEACAVIVPTADFIARHDSDHAAIQDEIEAAVMKQVRVLAAFKRPVAVEVSLTELPKSPIQKIKRNDVRERFSGDPHRLGLE
jgi:long-chain acyl-CoA synthetase